MGLRILRDRKTDHPAAAPEDELGGGTRRASGLTTYRRESIRGSLIILDRWVRVDGAFAEVIVKPRLVPNQAMPAAKCEAMVRKSQCKYIPFRWWGRVRVTLYFV